MQQYIKKYLLGFLGASVGVMVVKYARNIPFAVEAIVFCFLSFIGWLIGAQIARWIRKKEKPIVIKVIAWLNLFAWLFPICGVITVSATLKYSKISHERNRFLVIMGIISLALSIINGVAGVLNKCAASIH